MKLFVRAPSDRSFAWQKELVERAARARIFTTEMLSHQSKGWLRRAPEKVPSLGTSHLKVSKERRAFEPYFDFRWTCDFEETFNSFLKVTDGFVYGFALAGNIELGTRAT